MSLTPTAELTIIVAFYDYNGGELGPPVTYWFWTTEQINRYLAALTRHQINHRLLFRSDEHGPNGVAEQQR